MLLLPALDTLPDRVVMPNDLVSLYRRVSATSAHIFGKIRPAAMASSVNPAVDQSVATLMSSSKLPCGPRRANMTRPDAA